MEPLVRVSHLSKSFIGRRVVDDVSFDICKGEVLGFLGPNGAGKSTTMKMITGFLAPDRGRIEIAGLDMEKQPIAAKRTIGYLPEGVPLYGDMTVLKFLAFVGSIHGLRGKPLRSRLDEILSRINLQSVAYQTIETLSKGFKRRVGIAQSLIHDPAILVLDEPTDGLDPNQKHEVRNLIQEIAADKAIILSTHILEEVDAVCTRAIIIAEGKILADGTPLELKQRSPLHQTLSLTVPLADKALAFGAVVSVAGVKHVSVESESQQLAVLRILTDGSASLLEPVSAALRQKNVTTTELYCEQGRLDDVFRNITQPETPSKDNSESDSGPAGELA